MQRSIHECVDSKRHKRQADGRGESKRVVRTTRDDVNDAIDPKAERDEGETGTNPREKRAICRRTIAFSGEFVAFAIGRGAQTLLLRASWRGAIIIMIILLGQARPL